EDGPHRDRSLAERVPDDDDPAGQALRPCGANVSLAEDLEHAGPGQPGDDARVREPQREAWNKGLVQGSIAARPPGVVKEGAAGPVVERDAKEQEEQRGDDE